MQESSFRRLRAGAFLWGICAVMPYLRASAAETSPSGTWRSGLHAPACDQRVWGLGEHNGKLVAVGSFSHIGGSAAKYVGILGNGVWQGAGDRLGGAVRSAAAVATFHGELVVGGDFDPGVASWDGTSWRSLGRFDAYVNCLTVFAGRLIAGGRFGHVDGAAMSGLAQWDGTAWMPVGGGVAGPLREVKTLAVHAGRLLVGGEFTTVGGIAISDLAQWDGSTWSAVGGASALGSVSAIAVYQGDVIVAGHFFGVGGTAAIGIARWDGRSWHGLGEGVRSGAGIGLINCMVEYRGMLAVGGFFTSAGSGPFEHFAFWDGVGWSAPAGGLHSFEGLSSDVRALRVFEGDLYVGGTFAFAGSVFSPNLVRWQGDHFTAVEPGDGLVFEALAFHAAPDGMYAGGAFRFDGRSTHLEHVAAWRRAHWEPLGTGVDGPVHALVGLSNCLVAGGEFDTAGGSPAANVACWDGVHWSNLGDGLNGRVWALAVHAGTLFAAGDFTASGSVPLQHVARWDGHEWNAVGDGLPGPVVCLQEYAGALYAGGAFAIGSPPVSGIARWTGAKWSGVARGVNQVVRAMTVWDGRLVLGGVFGAIGDGTATDRLAMWDGTHLRPVHAGPFGVLEVDALAAREHELYVGGLINSPWNGVGAPLRLVNLIRFTGGQWSDIGELNRAVTALAARGTEVWAGGGFQRAGHTPSAGVAIWDVQGPAAAPLDLHGLWDCRGVRLQWHVPAALRCGDLVFRRRSADGEYADIGRMPAATTMTTFRDTDARGDTQYAYQLLLVSASRPVAVSTVIRVQTRSCDRLPVALIAGRTSSTSVLLSYNVATPGNVSLDVFDVRGRVVRRLIHEWQLAGPQAQVWDLRASDGTRVCRGVYVASLRDADGQATRRLLILHPARE